MSAILLKSVARHPGCRNYGVAELVAAATGVHSQNVFHRSLKTLNKYLRETRFHFLTTYSDQRLINLKVYKEKGIFSAGKERRVKLKQEVTDLSRLGLSDQGFSSQ